MEKATHATTSQRGQQNESQEGNLGRQKLRKKKTQKDRPRGSGRGGCGRGLPALSEEAASPKPRTASFLPPFTPSPPRGLPSGRPSRYLSGRAPSAAEHSTGPAGSGSRHRSNPPPRRSAGPAPCAAPRRACVPAGKWRPGAGRGAGGQRLAEAEAERRLWG